MAELSKWIGGREFRAKGRHHDQQSDHIVVTGPGINGAAEYAINDAVWNRLGAERALADAIDYTIEKIVLPKLFEKAGL